MENQSARHSRPANVVIFVSSTFRDMQVERDALRDIVLPKYILPFAEKYGAQVELVDLRWGVDVTDVSEEEQNKKTLMTCLGEIERSKPFFLGIIGDRYGWTPPATDLALALGEQDTTGLEGKSVTALEIELGALKNDNLSACQFMFRNIKDAEILSDDQKEVFFESGENIDKLKILKSEIIKTFGTPIYYDAHAQNNKALDIGDFSEKAAQGILAMLNSFWGEIPQETFSSAMEEVIKQDDFRTSHARLFVGRDRLLEELKETASNNENRLVLLKGKAGSGKTSLMAKLPDVIRDADVTKKTLVLSFFCGISAPSSLAEGLLTNLIVQLGGEKALSQTSNQNDFNELRNTFSRLLEEKAGNNKVVILIDALDQLNGDNSRNMRWLPQSIPENVHIVCSLIEGPEEGAAKKLGGIVKDIPNLESADIPEIVNALAAREHRQMPTEIINAISRRKDAQGKSAAENPLYLSLLIRDLVLLDRDDFDEIEKKKAAGLAPADAINAYMKERIEILPPDSEGVYFAIIEKISKSIGKTFVENVLSMIAISRFGLRESDIMGAFMEMEKSFNPADFSWLRQSFGAQFAQGENLEWDFAHQTLRRALVSKRTEVLRMVNEKGIVPYFMKKIRAGQADELIAREVLYHLWKADAPTLAAEAVSLTINAYHRSDGKRVGLETMEYIFTEENAKTPKDSFLCKIPKAAGNLSEIEAMHLLYAYDRAALYFLLESRTDKSFFMEYYCDFLKLFEGKEGVVANHALSIIYCALGELETNNDEKQRLFELAEKNEQLSRGSEGQYHELVTKLGGSINMRARLTQTVGDFYSWQGNKEKSLEYYLEYTKNRKSAFDYKKNLENAKDLAVGYQRLSEYYRKAGDIKEAKKYTELDLHALDGFDYESDGRAVNCLVIAHRIAANLAITMKDAKSAVSHLDERLRLLHIIYEKYPNILSLFALCTEVHESCRDLSDMSGKAIIDKHFGFINKAFIELSEMTGVEAPYKGKVYILGGSSVFREQKEIAYFMIADVSGFCGKYDIALDYFAKLIGLWTKNGGNLERLYPVLPEYYLIFINQKKELTDEELDYWGNAFFKVGANYANKGNTKLGKDFIVRAVKLIRDLANNTKVANTIRLYNDGNRIIGELCFALKDFQGVTARIGESYTGWSKLYEATKNPADLAEMVRLGLYLAYVNLSTTPNADFSRYFKAFISTYTNYASAVRDFSFNPGILQSFVNYLKQIKAKLSAIPGETAAKVCTDLGKERVITICDNVSKNILLCMFSLEKIKEEPNGEVYFNWLDNRTYRGSITEGKFTGRGRFTYPDGKVIEGRWENGKYLGK